MAQSGCCSVKMCHLRCHRLIVYVAIRAMAERVDPFLHAAGARSNANSIMHSMAMALAHCASVHNVDSYVGSHHCVVARRGVPSDVYSFDFDITRNAQQFSAGYESFFYFSKPIWHIADAFGTRALRRIVLKGTANSGNSSKVCSSFVTWQTLKLPVAVKWWRRRSASL